MNVNTFVRERQTDRQTETERQRQRETVTETERQAETERACMPCKWKTV